MMSESALPEGFDFSSLDEQTRGIISKWPRAEFERKLAVRFLEECSRLAQARGRIVDGSKAPEAGARRKQP